jgi:hypothetical protein
VSTGTPQDVPASTPAGSEEPERVYVKLPPPPPRRTSAGREGQRAGLQFLGWLFALALCVSIPAAPGIIMLLLLFQPETARHGLVWLWIAMFVLVEPIALLAAWGIWREVTGWSRAGDFLRE